MTDAISLDHQIIAQTQPNRIDSEVRTRVLDAASAIGTQLYREAAWDGSRASWSGWSMEPFGGTIRKCYRAFGPDLYSGTAGIALFLAHLYALTNDPKYGKLARAAADSLLWLYDRQLLPKELGYFSGRTGIGYTLIRLAELEIGASDRFRHAGIALLAEVEEGDWGASKLDLMNGCAGTIPALIAAAQKLNRPSLIEVARKQADLLLQHSVETDRGIAWPSGVTGQEKYLLGLSHGNAGCALALLEMGRAVSQAKYEKAAQLAFNYERSFFNVDLSNWPDFRLDPSAPARTEPSYPVAWCHGAVGIGCSRLRALDLVPNDASILQEVDDAIRATISYLTEPKTQGEVDFSLCHGVSGAGDFLLLCGARLNRPELIDIAANAATNALDHYYNNRVPWPCSSGQGGESPGLMLGLAGIGLYLLRICDAGSVESALIVKPELNERLEGVLEMGTI